MISLLPESRLRRSHMMPITALAKNSEVAAICKKRAWLSSARLFKKATKASGNKIAKPIIAAITTREKLRIVFAFTYFFMVKLKHRFQCNTILLKTNQSFILIHLNTLIHAKTDYMKSRGNWKKVA